MVWLEVELGWVKWQCKNYVFKNIQEYVHQLKNIQVFKLKN